MSWKQTWYVKKILWEQTSKSVSRFGGVVRSAPFQKVSCPQNFEKYTTLLQTKRTFWGHKRIFSHPRGVFFRVIGILWCVWELDPFQSVLKSEIIRNPHFLYPKISRAPAWKFRLVPPNFTPLVWGGGGLPPPIDVCVLGFFSSAFFGNLGAQVDFSGA